MMRSLPPAFARLLPLTAVLLFQSQPAMADLSFKPTYNKLQIAAADPATKVAPVAPPSVAAPAVPGSNKPPFHVAGKFSRGVQKYTGVTWLSSAIASQAAGMVVHHKLGGHVKVKVKSYSFTDLLAGKVKSVSVDVKEPKVSGVGLGEVKIASANPIWYAYRKDKHGNRGLQGPVLMIVKASLSQKQIAHALESPTVTEKLHGLKLELPGLGEQQLEVVKPNVVIQEDTLKVDGTLVTKGGTIENGVPITISAKPRLVGDNQIVLDQMKVNSPDIVEPEKFADFTSKLFNPVVDFARMDRRDHAFRLDALKVSGKDGELEGNGRLLLVPKPKPVVNQMAATGAGVH